MQRAPTSATRLLRASASRGAHSPDVWGIFEWETGSVQYVCADPATRKAAVIDPILDYDPSASRTSEESLEALRDLLHAESLDVAWILETHIHADHISNGNRLRQTTAAPHAVAERCREVGESWERVYNQPGEIDPQQHFDMLLKDGQILAVGDLDLTVILAPGHSPSSAVFRCGDALFAGDTLVAGEAGTARADAPGGSLADLWNSLRSVLAMPPETRVFAGHVVGFSHFHVPTWEWSVADHRAMNPDIADGTTREEFLARRAEKDSGMACPRRSLVAMHCNLRGGRMPDPEADGHRYLKIPVGKKLWNRRS
ncbi:MBL fold metallo-hydrolase [Roseivivax sp. CAU 1761]